MEVSFTKEYIEQQCTLALSQWGYDCEVKVETEDILCITVYSKDGVELDGQYCKFRFCRTEELTMGSSGKQHRKNYYQWEDGLQKFATESFWITRDVNVTTRGASTDAELSYASDYNASHRDEQRQRCAEYAAIHREENRQRCAAYNLSYRDELRQRCAEYFDAHREENRQRCADYRASHRDEHRQRSLAYYASHREEQRQRAAYYRASHREECRQRSAIRDAQLWTNGVDVLPWSTIKGYGRMSELRAKGWHPVSNEN